MIHKATVAITHKREREGEERGSERERETLARGGVGEGREEEAGRQAAGRGGLSSVTDNPRTELLGERGQVSEKGFQRDALGLAGLKFPPESPRRYATTCPGKAGEQI